VRKAIREADWTYHFFHMWNIENTKFYLQRLSPKILALYIIKCVTARRYGISRRCSTWYLTRSLHSLARYEVKHEKIYSISTSNYKQLYILKRFWGLSEDFQPLSEDLWSFNKNCSKTKRKFLNIYKYKYNINIRRLPWIIVASMPNEG